MIVVDMSMVVLTWIKVVTLVKQREAFAELHCRRWEVQPEKLTDDTGSAHFLRL